MNASIRAAALVAFCASTALADQPLKVTIQTEGVAFPEGSICRADVRAEYRIVTPRISAKDRGKVIAVTDEMATFRAPAPEQHRWRFLAAKQTADAKADPRSKGRQDFVFTLPAALPRVAGGSRAGVYVSVDYTIAVPGFPELQQTQTYVIRLDDAAPDKPISRCLRFELINDGTSLRAGLLPTCNDSFENRGTLLMTTD